MARAVTVMSFPMDAPDDMSGLSAALAAKRLDANSILSVWMKTEGNGLRNDHTRALSDLSLRLLLAEATGTSIDAMRDRVVVLASGGSEGVVSPHMVVVAACPPGPGRGLVAGTDLREVPAAERGGEAHADITAQMVAAAMQDAGITDPADVGLALVRAPTDLARPGHDPAVRMAAALGVARALGEAPPASFARCCFAVARHDDAPQQVLVLGNAAGGNPRLRIGSGILADPIDSQGAARILEGLGLHACPQLSAADSARVLAVIAKGDAPLNGQVRSRRHVMAIDNDVAMHRHARAAYGAMLSSVIGHTACVVSGGAEGQGPPDGGFAAVIVRTEEPA